jgi:hypothetical protein
MILVDDRVLQQKHLNQIHSWFTSRECAEMTKEDLFSAKIRQEIMFKKQ